MRLPTRETPMKIVAGTLLALALMAGQANATVYPTHIKSYKDKQGVERIKGSVWHGWPLWASQVFVTDGSNGGGEGGGGGGGGCR